MKATDLMFGVLILINNTPHKIRDYGELYYVGEDKIEGIPVTEDFFRENDWWEEWDYPGSFVKDVDKFHLVIVNNKLFVWFDYSPDDWGFSANVKAPIKYIHDIQHILRLYGLNEFADNFKV